MRFRLLNCALPVIRHLQASPQVGILSLVTLQLPPQIARPPGSHRNGRPALLELVQCHQRIPRPQAGDARRKFGVHRTRPRIRHCLSKMLGVHNLGLHPLRQRSRISLRGVFAFCDIFLPSLAGTIVTVGCFFMTVMWTVVLCRREGAPTDLAACFRPRRMRTEIEACRGQSVCSSDFHVELVMYIVNFRAP